MEITGGEKISGYEQIFSLRVHDVIYSVNIFRIINLRTLRRGCREIDFFIKLLLKVQTDW